MVPNYPSTGVDDRYLVPENPVKLVSKHRKDDSFQFWFLKTRVLSFLKA